MYADPSVCITSRFLVKTLDKPHEGKQPTDEHANVTFLFYYRLSDI